MVPFANSNNGRYGFVSKLDGKVYIKAEYYGADEFEDGLAKVGIRNKRFTRKHGFIDKYNNIVIPTIYDDFKRMREGLIPFKMEGKWGVLNKSGNIILSHSYDDISVFIRGLAIIKDGGKIGMINATGDIIVPIGKYDNIHNINLNMLPVVKDKKYGFIKTNGDEVFPCIFDTYKYYNDHEACAIKNDINYLVNINGDKIPFNNANKDSILYNDDIDELGNILFDNNGKIGLMNQIGAIIIPANYDSISLTDLGTYYEICKNGKKGISNAEGNELIPCKYDVVIEFSDTAFIAKYEGMWGCVDINGEEIVPFIHDDIADDSYFIWGLAALSLNNKIISYNDRGIQILPPKDLNVSDVLSSNKNDNYPYSEPCFVYLMRDTTNGYFKIGISNNPKYREKTLQSEKPTIELLASKQYPSRQVAENLESSLHRMFTSKRIRGEWFNLDDIEIELLLKLLDS